MMRRVIEEEGIELVGMARPLCLEPDLPRRLLQGEADAALPYVRPTARMRSLAGAAETGFYELQIGRLSRGQAPSLKTAPLTAALSFVVRDAWRGVGRTLFGD